MFYWSFFVESLRHGYYDNRFEVEAREASTEDLNQFEEKLLWKLREG